MANWCESDFDGVIDLIEMKAYHFDGNAEENAQIIDIPAHLADIAEQKSGTY